MATPPEEVQEPCLWPGRVVCLLKPIPRLLQRPERPGLLGCHNPDVLFPARNCGIEQQATL